MSEHRIEDDQQFAHAGNQGNVRRWRTFASRATFVGMCDVWGRCLLERDGSPAVRAERLAFGETAGRNEAWLRDTLFAYPDLLPLRDIDPSFGPLTPLVTELRTEAGPLDIAFINQFGRLTLVECKLWRNPEARRKVVAQALDYARAVSRWS